MNGYFDPLHGRVDRRHIARATIAVVGIGRVGALIAWELARLGFRRLILVDGDDYLEENRSGHPLPREYVGMNKAVAMAAFIDGEEIPGVENVTTIPYFVTPEVSDERLREDVLDPANLVVVATDDLEAQRRVALLARELGVPAIVPGVAEDGQRGEVFVSLTDEEPCLHCFDGYRPAGDPVRGAALVGPDVYPTIQLAYSLCIAVLDRTSREAGLFDPLQPGGPPPQLFRAWPPGAPELQLPDDGRTEVAWRANCPGCGGSGPVRRRLAATHRQAPPPRPGRARSLEVSGRVVAGIVAAILGIGGIGGCSALINAVDSPSAGEVAGAPTSGTDETFNQGPSPAQFRRQRRQERRRERQQQRERRQERRLERADRLTALVAGEVSALQQIPVAGGCRGHTRRLFVNGMGRTQRALDKALHDRSWSHVFDEVRQWLRVARREREAFIADPVHYLNWGPSHCPAVDEYVPLP